jgi:TonB family protein
LIFGLTSVSFAQKTAKPGRKVILQVKTEYPEILKDLRVGGQVRLTATVLPNGTVANVKVQGGNPILAENAVKAVKNWKYAPGPSQTEEEVVLHFNDR